MAPKLKSWLWVVGFALVVAFAFSPRQQPNRYAGRIPVRFWHMWSGEWEDVVKGICRDFNESQDKYEVVPLSAPGQDSKFLLGVIGGDPPDLLAHAGPVIPTWGDRGMIEPLDRFMAPGEFEQFKREAFPVVQRIGIYKGHLYGLTIGMNGFAAYYLPEHFREAGLNPNELPDTLEGMVAWGDKLHRFDAQGNLTRLGFLPPQFTWTAAMFGGGLWDWKTGRLTLETPENLRALEFLAAHRKKLGFDKVVRYNAGLNTGSFSAGWPFVGGAYSMTMDGQWRVEQLRIYAPTLKYKVAVVPPPRGGVPRAGSTNGNFMIIPTGSKNPAGAWAFARFWSGLDNPERAAKFYVAGGWLPLNERVASARIYREYMDENPAFRTFVELHKSPSMFVNPPVPYQVFLMDRVTRMEDAVLRGSQTPKQALSELRVKVEQEIQRRKDLGYDQ